MCKYQQKLWVVLRQVAIKAAQRRSNTFILWLLAMTGHERLMLWKSMFFPWVNLC